MSSATRDLWKLDDPIGPDNDGHLQDVAREVAESQGVLIAAWGRINPPARLKLLATERVIRVRLLLKAAGCDLRVLALNQDGSPKHPLYVPRRVEPITWAKAELPKSNSSTGNTC